MMRSPVGCPYITLRTRADVRGCEDGRMRVSPSEQGPAAHRDVWDAPPMVFFASTQQKDEILVENFTHCATESFFIQSKRTRADVRGCEDGRMRVSPSEQGPAAHRDVWDAPPMVFFASTQQKDEILVENFTHCATESFFIQSKRFAADERRRGAGEGRKGQDVQGPRRAARSDQGPSVRRSVRTLVPTRTTDLAAARHRALDCGDVRTTRPGENTESH
ncbi:hypothetical protein F2P81_001560 [Scophthalmus maximus]|uniref:Uncharacterized protein n=1 Tax=Scophthalmus maximus TaxID=52904 RepID=A0A6A4TQI6_SCOMX|nr:hypothetical protein F2P81_001560 [Scophthalmus maximus]